MHLSEYLRSTRVDLKKVTDGKSTLHKDFIHVIQITYVEVVSVTFIRQCFKR